MKHPWLTLLSFGVIGIIVLVFYAVSLQPVEIPEPERETRGTLDQPSVTYVNPTIGPSDAAVQIVEFGDFECDHCRSAALHLRDVVKQYPEEVQVVWKHMPNDSAHPEAVGASIAAQCAHRQGQFWPYHDRLFEQQSALSESLYIEVAQAVELDVEQFRTCVESRDTLPIVQRDLEEGIALDLTATPTLFINGERYVGSISRQKLFSLVQQALASANDQ